jgi:hypothetical protein
MQPCTGLPFDFLQTKAGKFKTCFGQYQLNRDMKQGKALVTGPAEGGKSRREDIFTRLPLAQTFVALSWKRRYCNERKKTA